MNVFELTLGCREVALPVLSAAFALPIFGLDVTYTSTGEFCAAPGPCPDATPLVKIRPTRYYSWSLPASDIFRVSGRHRYGKCAFVTLLPRNSTFRLPAQISSARTRQRGFTLYITQTDPAGARALS